jgi:hypothetical protein
VCTAADYQATDWWSPQPPAADDAPTDGLGLDQPQLALLMHNGKPAAVVATEAEAGFALRLLGRALKLGSVVGLALMMEPDKGSARKATTLPPESPRVPPTDSLDAGVPKAVGLPVGPNGERPVLQGQLPEPGQPGSGWIVTLRTNEQAHGLQAVASANKSPNGKGSGKSNGTGSSSEAEPSPPKLDKSATGDTIMARFGWNKTQFDEAVASADARLTGSRYADPLPNLPLARRIVAEVTNESINRQAHHNRNPTPAEMLDSIETGHPGYPRKAVNQIAIDAMRGGRLKAIREAIPLLQEHLAAVVEAQLSTSTQLALDALSSLKTYENLVREVSGRKN